MTRRRRFGDYELVRPLRSAGGDVWFATRLRDGTPCALKRLATGGADAGAARRRFARQITALARVRHAALPRLLDHGSVDGWPFLVTEWIRGRDLADWIVAGDRPLPTEVALAAGFAEVAGALQAIHAAGFVHRDIKPENVLLGDDGRLRLLDLGLVGRLEGDRETVTRTGEIVGTPATLAPEQVDPARGEVGPATDVYGLAATLLWVASGRLPVVAPSPSRLYERIAAGAVDLRERGLSAGLRAALQRALALDPRDRHPSARDFEFDLRRIADGEPPARWPGRRRALLRRTACRARSDRRLRGAAAAAFAAASVAAVVIAGDAARSATDDPVRALGALRAARRAVAARADLQPDRIDALRAARSALVAAIGSARAALAGLRPSDDPGVSATRASLEAELERALGATLPRAEHGIGRMRELSRRAADDDSAAWAAARRALAADPRFAGFVLDPVPGLVPIGPGRGGLWNFHDLRSAAAGAPAPQLVGDPPRLALEPRHGVVFVLLPPPIEGAAPLWFAAHELTRAQWRRLGDGPELNRHLPGDATGGGPPLLGPALRVSWQRARDLADHHGYDLPTRDEWWFAATAGGTELRPDDRDPRPRHANLGDRSLAVAARRDSLPDWDDGFPIDAVVGALEPNGFGLHDCFGNATEPVRDADERGGGELRLLVGGSWRAAPGARWLETGLRIRPESAREEAGLRLVLRPRPSASGR